ncbi:MAG TPA: hypothetical protein VGB06_05040 [Solirubrobacterales bacterium]
MDNRLAGGAVRPTLLLAFLLLAAGTPRLHAQSARDAAPAIPLTSAAETPTPVPPDEQLEAEGAVIGEVEVRVRDVFDPGDPREDRRLFRFANRLHRTTRESVIASQLLFRPGDRYSRRVLDESERLLRSDRYLRDAEIRPIRYRGNRVDLVVVTQDIWTVNAGLSFGRKGGANSTGFKLQDINLLGTGKSLTLQRSDGVDRSETLFRYDDHEVLGSRFQLGLGYSSNSDGSDRRIDLGRPFFSLDSRWAAGFSAVDDDRVDSLYSLGQVTGRFRHHQESFELRGGLSRGLVDGEARRLSAGFTFRRDRFAPAEGFGSPSPLPADRTLSYPWIAFDAVEDEFLEARDLDQIHRTEDFHLGRELHLRLGWSSPPFGADANAAIFDATATRGVRPGERQTLLLSSDLSGRWSSGGAEDLRLGGSARYYLRDFGDQLFFATLTGDVARNLDPEHQLLLGGDNGLRGYPLRYQAGDARLLLTLEQRFFTDFYPFRLFRVGGAIFFDAGRTWGSDPAGEAARLGLLRDVGIGVRLASSRSGLGSVIHLDLAFPLDGDGSIRRTQWLVTTKTGL